MIRKLTPYRWWFGVPIQIVMSLAMIPLLILLGIGFLLEWAVKPFVWVLENCQGILYWTRLPDDHFLIQHWLGKE